MVFRDIPTKNYIKYFIIVLLTLIVCVLFFIIYNNHKEESSVLRNKVSEIDVDDVDDYISENEIVFLYFGVVKDENSEKIENEMLKMIDEDDIDFIYVNITNVKNKKEFLKDFSSKYSSRKKVTNYPAFVYIKDSEIIDVIERDDRYLEAEDVKTFVDVNSIKGEKNA